jgi:hypothetical protein
VYPLRLLFFPLLGLAVLAYVLLPWSRRRAGVITYDPVGASFSATSWASC